MEKELYQNYKNISKQAEKAIKYKELKAESEKLKKSIYKTDSDNKSIELLYIKEKYEQNEELIRELQEKFDTYEKDLEKTIEDRDVYNEKYEQLDVQNKTLEKELELLGNNRIRLVERIKNLDKEINDKSTDIIYTLEKKEQREKKIEELGEKEIELCDMSEPVPM